LLIDHALQYAGRGWRVFPVHTTANGRCSCGHDCGKNAGKHPRIKAWQNAATSNTAQILKWWTKWPDANIGIATGAGLVITDLDGSVEIAKMVALARPHGGLPETLVAQTARGLHIYLGGDWPTTKKVATRPDEKTADGLLVRGSGGYVVAPPSLHASGVRYSWAKELPIAPMPDWFKAWLQAAENPSVTSSFSSTLLRNKPAYLGEKTKSNQTSITKRASAGLIEVPQTPYEMKRLTSALAAIPASCARDPWLHVGFALHSLRWERSDGSDVGFDLWNDWSATCPEKYSFHDVETVWRSFGKEGRSGVTLGTLYHLAEQHGWQGLLPRAADEQEVMPFAPRGNPHPPIETQPQSVFSLPAGAPHVNGHASAEAVLPEALTKPTNESPLIDLNNKYAAIGDIGGKCLVLGWVPSKVDDTVHVPSFQSFRSFAERYANRYIMVQKKKGDGFEEEPTQVGAYWLKWKHRRSFDGIDLIPGQPPHLPGNMLNLWQGFAVPPAAGRWDRMKEHIAEILAEANADCLDYIMRWSAWAVQNPGERAEVAMVFRGDKGAGKGTFAHALRRMFGQHGLHISNAKHLVGSFNAHLRNCLLLYADEAFWAGDKQGESVLKALITEPVQMIEQKGVDAQQWKNRVHLIMTANAEWVVPASHDERRYAVFNVSNKRLKDEKYFSALHKEMRDGGLAAMLHDLMHVDLGDWHPRRIPNTGALREQKARSMSLQESWWESLLQEGIIPAASKDTPDIAMAQYLMNHAREFAPRLKDLTPAALGRFLAEHGCIKLHKANGNAWRFPALSEARGAWERRYQGWDWEQAINKWLMRS
jgi:hypothetical protein